MFTSRPIGFVNSPYKETSEIPKGLGAKHEAEGTLKILSDFEPGLTDIEGFSHLVVLWEFDRSQGFELLGKPPSDNRPHGVFCDPISATPESDWDDYRRTTSPRWPRTICSGR